MITTYKLDDPTYVHLAAWCERETRDYAEAEWLLDRIKTFLESLPVEDAEYSLSHGWSHVRNLAEAV